MARIALTNVNLFDGSDLLGTGHTIVIEDDRIAEVSKAQGSVPPVDEVVDLANKTVMPGMVSGHFHSTYVPRERSVPFGMVHPPVLTGYKALHNAQLALRCGFTTTVGAGCASDVDASLKEAIDEGLFEGPRVVPGSRDVITTGDSNHVQWWYGTEGEGVRVCDGPDDVTKAVREEMRRGAEVVKIYASGGHGLKLSAEVASMSERELRAAADAAHDRGRRVRAHVSGKEAIMRSLRAGVDIIDHADGMDDECIEQFAALGTIVLPSLLFPARRMRATGDMPGGPGHEYTTELGKQFAWMCDVLPKAVAAGVVFVVGDDYGPADIPHGDYAHELAVYVEHAGIEPVEVLRWATRNGAQLADTADTLGVIEPGMVADLVVVDGNPCDDITVLVDGVTAVMKGGRFVLGTHP